MTRSEPLQSHAGRRRRSSSSLAALQAIARRDPSSVGEGEHPEP